MNPALLYRKRGRSIFWIAFASAIAIHLGAVALAKNKSPTARLEQFTPPGDVEIVNASEPEPPLDDSVAPPPLDQIRPDEDSVSEENLTPPPVRSHRGTRPASPVRGMTASLNSVKATVLYAPRPTYPYEARRQRITGSGVALLSVDSKLGSVTDVLIAQSCGNAVLDDSTRQALRRWRFKPGTVARVQVPITYTLMGVSY